MSGEFTRTEYDNCHYQNRLIESTGPLAYQLYRGAHVNQNKCEVYQPQQLKLVDVESELKGIHKMNSRCSQFKHRPNMPFSKKGPNIGISTFSKYIPVTLPAEVCPDVETYLYFNNGLLRPSAKPKWPEIPCYQGAIKAS